MKKVVYLIIVICFLLLIYPLIEPNIITIKEYQIENEELKGLSIAFLTDFHHSRINSKNKIKRIVNKTNRLNPDFIILGGDFADQEQYIDGVFEELKHLEALAIYAVLGNHDYINEDKVKEKINEHFILLENNYGHFILNNKSVKIAGIGDIWNERPNLNLDYKGDEYVILASHNPDYAETIAHQEIDLMLSGHTHGGQFTLLGYAPYVPSAYNQKYRTGFVQNPNVDVIVSNGLGSTFLPIRFFAPPQIVIINFI